MDVKLFDVNTAVFDSEEEVGLSIVTLTELTKGLSDHGRHRYYKKFISVWNKDNYHIYLPHELDDLQTKFIEFMEQNKIDEAYDVLDAMCEKILRMIFVYFSQMICLIMISVVFLNFKLVIQNGEIPYNNGNEREMAEFNNYVAKTFAYIYENQNTIFKNCHKEWKKDDGNKYGNCLFGLFAKNYFKIINKPNDEEICLCGDAKNIDSLFTDEEHNITLEKLNKIFESYLPYKMNGELTKKVFIPHLMDAINDPKMKFEFNHISDSFLIFNALTCAKTEGSNIVIDSTDGNVNKIYLSIKEHL